jgi:hypothetical protein
LKRKPSRSGASLGLSGSRKGNQNAILSL